MRSWAFGRRDTLGFLIPLKKAFHQQKLIFPGKTSPLADPATFQLLNGLEGTRVLHLFL
jgi:hypothetical protein